MFFTHGMLFGIHYCSSVRHPASAKIFYSYPKLVCVKLEEAIKLFQCLNHAFADTMWLRQQFEFFKAIWGMQHSNQPRALKLESISSQPKLCSYLLLTHTITYIFFIGLMCWRRGWSVAWHSWSSPCSRGRNTPGYRRHRQCSTCHWCPSRCLGTSSRWGRRNCTSTSPNRNMEVKLIH